MLEKLEVRHERSKLEDVVPLSAPFILSIDPCGACNFKCVFCPCNHSEIKAEERHKMMSWELFTKIAEDIKAFGPEGVKVISVSGFGEPLLSPFVADMVRVLKKNHSCREIRMTTNAALLDEEKSRALIDAGINLVRVSVEALSTEGYKELCGVDIDFLTIVHNIETFYRLSRNTGSKISAKIVSATLKTAEDFQTFHELFAPITDSHFMEEIEPFWHEFEEMKMPAQDHIEADKISWHSYHSGEARTVCSFPFTDLYIRSNGLVSPCCADWKFDLTLGDITKEHLIDIWNGKKTREFQCAHLAGELQNYPVCQICNRRPADPIQDPQYILEKIRKQCL